MIPSAPGLSLCSIQQAPFIWAFAFAVHPAHKKDVSQNASFTAHPFFYLWTLKTEILVLQPAQIEGGRTGRDPLEGIVTEGPAVITGLHHSAPLAKDGVSFQLGAAGTVQTARLDIFPKQHGGTSFPNTGLL